MNTHQNPVFQVIQILTNQTNLILYENFLITCQEFVVAMMATACNNGKRVL